MLEASVLRKGLIIFTILILLISSGCIEQFGYELKPIEKTISEQEVLDTSMHTHGISVPPEYYALKNPIPLTDESRWRGRETYQRNCYRCHGLSGKGDGPDAIGIPLITSDLSNKERMAHHTDGDHFYVITYGAREGKFMSAFGGKLTENETWELVNYIHTLH